MRETKTKHDLEILIVLRRTWREMMEIKHRLYRCCLNYALSKRIASNGLENLWKKENHIPLSSPAAIDVLAQDPG